MQGINIEVQRGIEQARKALQETLGHKTPVGLIFGLNAKELEALAGGSVDIEEGATVVVKKGGSSVKTIVKTDDTGTYVIVANPKKRLTAHDKDGKLLFDAEIESHEQQQKLPAELLEKVKTMLQQMGPAEGGEPEPQAQSDGEPKI